MQITNHRKSKQKRRKPMSFDGFRESFRQTRALKSVTSKSKSPSPSFSKSTNFKNIDGIRKKHKKSQPRTENEYSFLNYGKHPIDSRNNRFLYLSTICDKLRENVEKIENDNDTEIKKAQEFINEVAIITGKEEKDRITNAEQSNNMTKEKIKIFNETKSSEKLKKKIFTRKETLIINTKEKEKCLQREEKTNEHISGWTDKKYQMLKKKCDDLNKNIMRLTQEQNKNKKYYKEFEDLRKDWLKMKADDREFKIVFTRQALRHHGPVYGCESIVPDSIFSSVWSNT